MRDWQDYWERGETPWDKGEAAPPLLECLEGGFGEFLKSARVLVPGCGSGHDVRALVAAGAEVTGMDLSAKAVEVAEGWEPVGDEIFLEGDFLAGDLAGFDAIWEHTCFCAIEPDQRDAYVAAAAMAVREGGRFYGVFYLTPDNDEDGPPYAAEIDEIVGRFSPWFTLLDGRVPERAFPGREGREWLAVFERLGTEVAPGGNED